MKTSIITLLLALSVMLSAAQGCLPEGISFFYQEEIDNFQTNYPGCTEIEGDVYVGNWMSPSNISNLNGLDVLTSIGCNLIIGNNPALTSLMGLSNLNTMWGGFGIYWNGSLTSLAGLDNVSFIGGSLGINDNDALINLTGLEGLTSIPGSLYIGDNSALTSFIGLEGLTFIGEVTIRSNEALTSFTGLDNLTSIGGLLNIRYNNALNNLTGLAGLSSIGDGLILEYNNSLASLTGLLGLSSIGGGIAIWNNAALTSLTGLDNIDADSITDLHIYTNDLLSICDVQSICDYLASPNGTISIFSNATGCNSQKEVEEACLTDVPEQSAVSSHQSAVSAYPNPTGGNVDFRLSIFDCRWVSLGVYNAQGQEVAVVLDEALPAGEHMVKWDAERLPAGIYCYRLTAPGLRPPGSLSLPGEYS